MAVRVERQEFTVREAADYLGVDVRLTGSLFDSGRIGGPFRGGRQLISRASLERYLDRFGGRDGLQAALREEERHQARDRKKTIAEARLNQWRAHDQAAQLQARLADSVRFRSTASNTSSIKGEKRNRTIPKLLRSWHLFKKGGDSKGMAEAAEQLARLGVTRA